jgi:hypothetical protein
MPYQRYLVQNGRVNISGGKCFPHYGSIVSSPTLEDVKVEKEEKEVVGNGISNELTNRLNALNIKKPSTDLQSRLMAVDPKRKLINFTI